MVSRLHEAFIAANVEAAHLKLIGQWEGAFAVANLIPSQEAPELSLASNRRVTSVHLTINARVGADPALIEKHGAETLQDLATALRLQVLDRHTQCFRPGQPIRMPALSTVIDV